MTRRDDIIRMAREAAAGGPEIAVFTMPELERFAALVSAAEREACAKVCEQRGMVKGGEVFAARIRARSNT